MAGRNESMITNSSAILIEGEIIRQRHQRLLQADVTEDCKDYLIVAHALSDEKLQAVLKTKYSGDGSCTTGPGGLKEDQAHSYAEHYGENCMTPPIKPNKWVKLLELMFLGIFNIMLWACVIAQVALIVIFSRSNASKTPQGTGTKEDQLEDSEEKKEDNEADYVTPIILASVIIMAALLQWYAEQKAQDQMDAMQKMQSAAKVKTLRRGPGDSRLEVDLDPKALVPGDIIFMQAGDRVPADVRIIHCTDGMEVDNAALTGESMPEPRKALTEKINVAPADAKNLAFFGTTVLKGNSTCVVHATGDATYLGKIARSICTARPRSTLEDQIEHFIHIIAFVAIVIGLLSLAANIFSPTKRPPPEILQNASAALFAQVPEGLLPTVTISLMIASSQMVTRHVLVRKIDAVETLGCVSVFCSDKTGTLTKGEMTVQDFVVPYGKAANIGTEGLKTIVREKGGFPNDELLASTKRCGMLNNAAEAKDGKNEKKSKKSKATSDDGPLWIGSPTEVAILRACSEVNGGSVEQLKELKLKPENVKKFEIPFNSENKFMVTIHGGGSQATLIMKGAPDRVLPFCSVNKDQKAMDKIEEQMNALMGQARRVLCVAKREIPGQPKYEGTCGTDCNFPLGELEFVGLYGIEDPPKDGVDTAVVKAQKAGVKVVMVTGDHPATARAIAKRINILTEAEEAADNGFIVITGTMLEKMVPQGDNFAPDEDESLIKFWTQATKHARVFARVSPIHKQVIVQAYQNYGYDGIGDICAMTGDGVNDAPALKQAQVGVAMGIRGTEVAKDAADIVLQDDNFPSVIDGIEQGRLSSENLQKSIMYTLCSKVPQVLPTFVELFGIPPALTVAQVLLIDIGTDIWTAIAYALQPAESKLMDRDPRHPKLEKLVNWKVLLYSYFYIGMLQAGFCWLMFFKATPGMSILVFGGTDENGVEKLPVAPKDYTSDEFKTVITQGKTVYYWTLVLGQIAAAISTTTKVQSVFGFFQWPAYCFPNMTLNLMFVGEILLGLAAIYTTPGHLYFDTGALDTKTLLTPIWACAGICLADEIRKLIVRTFFDHEEGEASDSGSEDSGSDSNSGSDSESASKRPLLC